MKKLDERTREEYANDVIEKLRAGDQEGFRESFLDLHAIDQLGIFDTLNASDRKQIYTFLTPKEFADIFQEMEYEQQLEISKELDEEYLAGITNEMYADDAADFIGQLPENMRDQVLETMDDEEASEVEELMSYPDETAGALMTKEFLSIKATDTVRDVMAFLQKEGPEAETIYYLYVINDEEALVGVLSLRDLIINSHDELIENLMSTRVIAANVTDDQEEVAKLIEKYDLLAAPVVTETRKLVGIITVDDVIDVIQEELTEDIGEISAARGATDENVTAFQAAKKRSPWIVMLMVFGMITAGVIEQFEGTLEEIAILAAFIPLIMDSAGNTGTQSLAVVVRSLATGVLDKKGVGKTIFREFQTGMMIGVASAIALIILVSFLYGNPMLAVVVATSIFISLSIATVVGTIFPLIINKLKLDPAIASGPFITTLNDVIGLLIYFSIATSLIQYL
ncbi:magnesium transporter [Salsuginibacillus halophilus]|uniref:Magnesium transporter MgtE n=1 Tax=Salsuginibacillus halophilus TaxID=517424 RepID=A0A2P8HE08_9BACI|nr:magnesium transporter [Salsuginibacillus halophilus]PSL44401.1 magnesium transporter [Salsuginibacillus halophilus]